MPILFYGTSLSPPCRAVMLTAKAIGVDMEHREVNLIKNEQKNEDYMKMNPTHTVPTMDDNGLLIWESRAIMAYLVQRYGNDDALYPKDPVKRALVDNMLYFDATCLFLGASQYYQPVLNHGQPPDPAKKAVVIERLGFLDTILGRHPYAAGERLTIADFSLMCSMSLIESVAIGLDDFSNIRKWMDRIKTEVKFYDEVTKEGIEILKGFFLPLFKK